MAALINKNYLDKKSITAIKKEFKNKGVVKLDYFLESKEYNKLKKSVKKIRFFQKKAPDTFSYSTSKSNPDISKLLNIKEIKNFIKQIAGDNYNLSNLSIKKFKHRDYSIMHDSGKIEKGLEFIFFLCENWNPMWGGNKVYVKNEKTFLFTPKGNSFILINNKKFSKTFTQYINHLANKNSIILINGELKEI